MNERSIVEQLLRKLEEVQGSLGMMAVPGATDNYPVNEWAASLFHSCTDVIAKAHQELGTYTGEVKRRHELIKNVKDWTPPDKQKTKTYVSRLHLLHTILSE